MSNKYLNSIIEIKQLSEFIINKNSALGFDNEKSMRRGRGVRISINAQLLEKVVTQFDYIVETLELVKSLIPEIHTKSNVAIRVDQAIQILKGNDDK